MIVMRISSTPPPMRLRPAELGAALQLWALRREKVLEILDVRAARHARKLAISCNVLAEMEGSPLLGDSWQAEWRRTRQEALAMLTHAKLGAARRAAPKAGAPRVLEAAEAPVSERVTRVSVVPAALHDCDPPTRVRHAAWNLERDEVQVA